MNFFKLYRVKFLSAAISFFIIFCIANYSLFELKKAQNAPNFNVFCSSWVLKDFKTPTIHILIEDTMQWPFKISVTYLTYFVPISPYISMFSCILWQTQQNTGKFWDKYVHWHEMSQKSLTYFLPMFPFYTPWEHQKTKGFLVFSGGIKWEHWPEMA